MRTIRIKLLVVISSVVLIVLAIVMGLIETINRNDIVENNFNTLRALREIKSTQVQDYIEFSRNQMITMSESNMVIEAMKSFKSAFHDFSEEQVFASIDKLELDNELNEYYADQFLPKLTPNIDGEVFASNFIPSSAVTKVLQYLFIAKNPYPIGEKQKLFTLDSSAKYSKVHERYHPGFLSFTEKFGFYDFFLVDSESGHIVYSTYKEIDYATSLLNGPHGTTSLARLFREARQATFGDFVRMEDFQPYIPSYNAPASFIASPIFDQGKNIGVLIFQMPVDRINHFMTYDNNWENVGLGKSGETYIVSSDFTLRNQSRFLMESKVEYLQAILDAGVDGPIVEKISNFNSSIGLQPVRTDGSIDAINGNSGEAIFKDYRGVKVLSSYGPLELKDLKWSILSEIDLNEAKLPIRKLRLRFLIVFIVMLPVSLILGWLFSRGLTSRIKKINQAAILLSEGHLNQKVNITGNDEISSLEKSFEKMRVSIQDLLTDQAKTIEDLSASMIPLTDDIGVMVLIGILDENRLDLLRKRISQDLSSRFHKIVILDVSSVPNIDEFSGKGLIKIAKTVRLMGSEIILSGVQASMALDMTNLEINLQGINTQNTLQNAINFALKIIEDKKQ